MVNIQMALAFGVQQLKMDRVTLDDSIHWLNWTRNALMNNGDSATTLIFMWSDIRLCSSVWYLCELDMWMQLSLMRNVITNNLIRSKSVSFIPKSVIHCMLIAQFHSKRDTSCLRTWVCVWVWVCASKLQDYLLSFFFCKSANQIFWANHISQPI